MSANTITFRIEPPRRAVRRKREPGAAATEKLPAIPPVPRLARMLALAYLVESLIESGELRDHAHTAQLLGISRPRMTQVMNLLFLPVPLQEDVLLGRVKATERGLREALKDPVWPSAVDATAGPEPAV